FSARNKSTHDCAARLSHSRTFASAKAIDGAHAGFRGSIHLAVASVAWRLVSLVVVTPNEIPVSLGHVGLVRHQSHSGSRDGAWQARSSILINAARHDRDLRRVELADKGRPRGCLDRLR